MRSPSAASAPSWSSDGQTILYSWGGIAARVDLYWMSLAERKPHVYLATSFVETAARFSPDGKWVAYQSNESGRMEVYLAPFPSTRSQVAVSSNAGGFRGAWRWKELYYVASNNT